MGKRAQLKKEQAEKILRQRKDILESMRQKKQSWRGFWHRFDFWVIIFCFALLAAFPLLGPRLEKYQSQNDKKITASDYAVIRTSFGEIEVELLAQNAPRTVQNFIELSKRGYYNNLSWHRVIKDFMIQGGDPKGDGSGGESAFGVPFEDEINARDLGLPEEQIKQLESQGYRYNPNLQSKKMEVGSVAMANSGPNTNGSQFFIITEQSQPHLNGKHTVFGKVMKGIEVVRTIASVEVDENDRPKETVYISSIEIK